MRTVRADMRHADQSLRVLNPLGSTHHIPHLALLYKSAMLNLAWQQVNIFDIYTLKEKILNKARTESRKNQSFSPGL